MPKSPIPFDLSTDSLDAWLESISSLSPVNAGSQLNKAVNTLRKSGDDGHLLYPLLVKLTPISLHLSNSLAITAQNNPGKSSKIAKLSLQLLRNLSLAFHSLIDEEPLEIDPKLQSVYFALQLTGQHLRISNLFHEIPSTTLWNMSGELYVFALENQLLRQAISCKIVEFKSQSTIEAVLKRNLLLTILSSHALSDSDNQALYSFCNRYFNDLDYGDQNGFFSWNYTGSLPGQSAQAISNRNELMLDTSKLSERVQTKEISGSFSSTAYEQILRNLSGYQKLMIDSIPSVPIIFNMLSGLSDISAFLQEREKLIKIHKLSSELKEEKHIYDMSLEPLEHEKNFFNSSVETLEKTTSPATIMMGQPIKCLRTTQENFLIIESRKTDLMTGSLIILINKNNAIIPGIIRQQKAIKETNTARLLIEKFQGQLTAYSSNSDNEKNKPIIVANESSVQPEVFLPPDKYHCGNVLEFNFKTARLLSLTEFSPEFVRFRISFD